MVRVPSIGMSLTSDFDLLGTELALVAASDEVEVACEVG